MSVTFRILGPLEVLDAGRPVALGGPRQRALLAILLLRANQVVSTDQLIDGLWGEAPPPTARQTVQVYVSQLRRALPGEGSPDGRSIETRAPGYLLHVAPGQLDVDRFEELVAAGRSALSEGEAGRAADVLREALGLWRGAPLADFAYEDFAQAEIARLEERRLACVEERVEADLALGRHSDLVAELETLVAAHPLRERLRGQLMVALYGSGRQAEALECYAAGRRALADELGLEPGGALRDLERRILNQDPDFLPAAPVPVRSGPARETWRPIGQTDALPVRRDRRLVAACAAILAAAVVAGIVLSTGGGDGSQVIPGDSVVAIDAAGGRATKPVQVGASPNHIAVADGAVWVGGAADRTLRRIDTRTNAVVDTIPVGGGPDGIAAGNGSVWVTSAFAGTLARVKPETNTIVQTIAVPNGPRGVALGDGAVWVASLYARAVTRIDPETGERLGSTVVGGSPVGVATGEGAVWVTNETDASLFRINPRNGKVVQTIGVGTGPGPVAVGAGSVWVGNTLDATVSRIDPATNRVTATIGVGEGPAGLVAGHDGVWVANELDGSVMRIDPARNAVVETISTGQRPAALALDGRLLWVASQDASATHRGGTLRVAVDDFDSTIDQFDYSVLWQVNLTGDGLTAYRRAPGAPGATLVPDLAVAIPAPTDGGRTYTFQLRRGVGYSNGDTVEPADIRRAIERLYRLGGPARTVPPFYDVIVGAAACRARPARCDLSRGIVEDAAAGTVTIHLTRPDPNVLHYLALPFANAVARSSPAAEVVTEGLPATGPYVVASRRPGREVRLVRNPRFREWSKAARPDGYPDEIVLTVAVREPVRGVEQDRFDLTLSGMLDPADLERLSVRYPGRIRAEPVAGTLHVALNTSVPPFDELDARRAVATALDRDALVRLLGGAQAAQTTCQILPPNFPSYELYCPFIPGRRADGSGGSPDIEEGRRLVARSRTAGARVVVSDIGSFPAQAREVARVLRQLGYRATARPASEGERFDAYGRGPTRIQVMVSGWFIDYPAPSSFFEQLRCGAMDPARFCDRSIDRQFDEALALQATDPVAADRAWARLDRALTDQAAWIPYATPRTTRFTGRRLGNYQHHPVWHALLDQVWVQ